MAVKKHKLKINGMHCTSCSMLIDGDLEDTEGIMKAATNYAKQETYVEFDEDKITIKKIVEVVKNSGYEVSAVQD